MDYATKIKIISCYYITLIVGLLVGGHLVYITANAKKTGFIMMVTGASLIVVYFLHILCVIINNCTTKNNSRDNSLINNQFEEKTIHVQPINKFPSYPNKQQLYQPIMNNDPRYDYNAFVPIAPPTYT